MSGEGVDSLVDLSIPAESRMSIPVWSGPWPTHCERSLPVCPPAAPALESVWYRTGPEGTAYNHWTSCSYRKKTMKKEFFPQLWIQLNHRDQFSYIYSLMGISMAVNTINILYFLYCWTFLDDLWLGYQIFWFISFLLLSYYRAA